MTHLVITNSKDGENVTWKKKLTDAEYQDALKQIASAADIGALNTKEQSLVRVAAFAAADQQEGLTLAVQDALDSGVSISELRESLIHLYSYAGFPRSLNALGNLMSVVEARREAGKKDETGPEPADIAEGQSSQKVGEAVQTELVGQKVSGPLFDFAPGINDYLQSHLFGDIFARGVLDYKQRELLTVAILASLEGTESQLNAHIGIATNTGVSQAQLQGVAETLAVYKGRKYAARVTSAIESTLGE
jgi:alkylhydroperoxidase/carboxymuconolactone decarboxylase family protein YurZ